MPGETEARQCRLCLSCVCLVYVLCLSCTAIRLSLKGFTCPGGPLAKGNFGALKGSVRGHLASFALASSEEALGLGFGSHDFKTGVIFEEGDFPYTPRRMTRSFLVGFFSLSFSFSYLFLCALSHADWCSYPDAVPVSMGSLPSPMHAWYYPIHDWYYPMRACMLFRPPRSTRSSKGATTSTYSDSS